jgi:hypothetical protein
MENETATRFVPSFQLAVGALPARFVDVRADRRPREEQVPLSFDQSMHRIEKLSLREPIESRSFPGMSSYSQRSTNKCCCTCCASVSSGTGV